MTMTSDMFGHYRRELILEAEYEAAIMSGDTAERALAKERYEAAKRRTAVLASIAEYAAAPQASAGCQIVVDFTGVVTNPAVNWAPRPWD